MLSIQTKSNSICFYGNINNRKKGIVFPDLLFLSRLLVNEKQNLSFINTSYIVLFLVQECVFKCSINWSMCGTENKY